MTAIEWFAVALFWVIVIGFMGLLVREIFTFNGIDHQFGLPRGVAPDWRQAARLGEQAIQDPEVTDEQIRQALGEHYFD